MTPADFIDGTRLTEARERLALADQTIETVAYSVGYKSADAFRRAFERRYGIQPSNYRKHFSSRSTQSFAEVVARGGVVKDFLLSPQQERRQVSKLPAGFL